MHDAILTGLGVLAATAILGAPAAAAPIRESADILPPSALAGPTIHPLDARIRSFLANQSSAVSFQPSGLASHDYLKTIARQVAAFRKCQDETGAIIDPVMEIEWQYSTPCYALSVALLARTGYTKDRELIDSGIRAMTCSVDEMHEYRTAHNHGEFFIQPVMLALDLFDGIASTQQTAEWKRKLAELDPYKLYPDNLKRKQKCYNHNVVALAGEYLREKKGMFSDRATVQLSPELRAVDREFFGTHLAHQAQYMSPLGMYKDPNVPMVYDEFSRQFLVSILCEGYRGSLYATYRDALWKGAWTSLFMQSPFGECPTGGRSAQHIWNEAQCCVTYEVYAAQYARKGMLAEAGAFKRAAHLSLGCIRRWTRPDGSGYVVKNRYPIEARYGYERYSAQSQYNLLACWLMAVAYLYAVEPIDERPCPADVGGFVVPMVEDFHKVFANAGGAYVEYDTRGDLRYNPTGLIRTHIMGSNPQIGPSDGVVHKFDSMTKEDLGGENLCVGPAWWDSSGTEHRLADYNLPAPPKVEVLEESPKRTRFRVIYEGEMDGVTRLTETVTLDASGVTVEDVLEGPSVGRMRVYYPMLVFDGLEEAEVAVAGNEARLRLWDGGIRFSLLEPKGAELKRTGKRLDSRNGQMEAAYADIEGSRAVYRIRAD